MGRKVLSLLYNRTRHSFELVADPTEHVDVAATEPAALKTMLGRLGALQVACAVTCSNPAPCI